MAETLGYMHGQNDRQWEIKNLTLLIHCFLVHILYEVNHNHQPSLFCFIYKLLEELEEKALDAHFVQYPFHLQGAFPAMFVVILAGLAQKLPSPRK